MMPMSSYLLLHCNIDALPDATGGVADGEDGLAGALASLDDHHQLVYNQSSIFLVYF